MALPAQYNISYYRGDTYTLWILPRDQAGNAVDLTGYTAKFTAAIKRGPLDEQEASFSPADFDATVDVVENKVKCEITPTVGATLDPTLTYYYDVQLSGGAGLVYTYLTGTLSVTADVSDA